MIDRDRIVKLTGLAATVVLLAACGETEGPVSTDATSAGRPAPAETSEAKGLQRHYGSTWQLVRIQSMDDTETRPDAREKYTLTFEESGEVAVRADCNRGRGSFTSTAAGQLEFGPLATTRAMCPPGSISDQYLSQLGYVRSYVLDDGMLHLATLADGSILDFELAGAD